MLPLALPTRVGIRFSRSSTNGRRGRGRTISKHPGPHPLRASQSDSSIIGLPDDARLTRMFDVEGCALHLPPTGLLVSKKLADLLGARVGDRLLVQFLEGPQPRHELVLHGLIGDYHGLNAAMNINAVRRLMLEKQTPSTAHTSKSTRLFGRISSKRSGAADRHSRNQVRDEGKLPTVDGGITATDPKNLFPLCNSSRVRSRLWSSRISFSERSRRLGYASHYRVHSP